MPFVLALLADATLIDAYRAKTAAERRCVVDRQATDITVCGRRNADRFRVPLAVAGEPARGTDAAAERGALVRAETPMDRRGPFLVGGGHVGVSMSTRHGLRGTGADQRKLAP